MNIYWLLIRILSSLNSHPVDFYIARSVPVMVIIITLRNIKKLAYYLDFSFSKYPILISLS